MFTTLKNAFKIKEIRKKLLFTLAMVVVIRLGSNLPVPGVDRTYFSNWFESLNGGGAFDFLNAITGGSFTQFSILALGINPYITSSIIMQLLTIAIPKLEEMQKDGDDGRKKIASITRYVTVVLALIQSTAMAIGFGGQGLIPAAEYNAFTIITVVAALTAGSAFLMWIGERITEHGIGNGISMVLVINIVSSLPTQISALFEQFVMSKISTAPATAILAAVIIIAALVLMIVLVIILNGGVRKIPVQYAKKMQGRKMVGGQASNIPLKVNTSGVIPVIFASSLMQFPIIINSFLGGNATGVWAEILKVLDSSYWCKPSDLKYTVGMLVYIVLIIFFAYFYTSITFNPLMVSDNMKKQGGFIPGIRPGKPTTEYLTSVLNSIIFIGAIGLTIIGILPFVLGGIFNTTIAFGGTSLIIVVSVILDTIKQVESQMLVRNYKGFLNS